MVQLNNPPEDPTGEDTEPSTNARQKTIERARQMAVDVVTGGDGTDVRAADGGLRPATIRWLETNPDADTEAVLAYDRNAEPYADDVSTADLPPRGEPGSESNFDRAAAVNEARRLIREYRDLEGRTE